MADLNTPYWVSVPAVGRCVVVQGEKMEEVKEFMYLGTMLCKNGGRNKRERCERQVCHRITYKSY